MQKKKIYIVTGGTGFVGSHVVKKLESLGETVVTLARSEAKVAKALPNTKAKVVYGNVLNPADLEKLFMVYPKSETCFIHAASIVYLGGNRKKIKEMQDTNINGVKNVIEICKKHGCRLLFVSSVHAITEKPKRGLITEIQDFNPKTVVGAYAKTKAEASRLVMNAVKNEGLDAVIVHPSGITGPEDPSGTHMTQTVEDFRNKRIPASTSGGYDFVDVRDVADGIIAAVQRGKSGDCYLLTNKYYSAQELLDMLHELGAGKKIRVKLPMFLAQMSLPFLAFYFWMLHKRPLYTAYSLYTLKSNSNFSCERAKRELGYHPRDLKESLRDVVNG